MDFGSDFWTFVAIGIFAQLVDGALGMAFGVIGSSVLMASGVAPAQASAMIHIAEIFTTAASGISHYVNKNVSWSIVKRIALPGVIGGIVGATVLANIDGKKIAPFVSTYLLIIGVIIVIRALRAFAVVDPSRRGMPAIGFAGGTLDAVGGGGWGPVVTSTLIGTGHVPRYVIGSVNLTEFFVTVATSATLILHLGWGDLSPVVPLILGGLIAAPFAGLIARVAPTRILMVVVGLLVIGLATRSLLRYFGML
ncbi:MAG: sulfite exporter TauE/SafE family protein [Xanthobacteraceae bacterium]|nr:sulfite exporter TauE/SafE family protein [Xanthobacteraceae bacterium]QYK44236.1 MAG: sulfite exporter TauE/SafE family protein [Xanthobacteraceae bacterium]